jgi:hypothetical protein
MRFRRKPEPKPMPFDDQLIQDWQIVTPLGEGGAVATLSGHVSGWQGSDEAQAYVRYIRGITNGLRDAGFDPKVTVTRRESKEWTP